MAGRRRAVGLTGKPAKAATRFYTAQDVADFCEVDLKTIHHWADAGKMTCFRTDGRHLRFRRNDVVRFLRSLDYPLPSALLDVKPIVFFAAQADEAWPLTEIELVRKLSPRFSVRPFASALEALTHLFAEEPDALVVSTTDPSIAGAASIETLKGVAPWLVVAAIGAEAGRADVVVLPEGVARLGQDLARILAIR